MLCVTSTNKVDYNCYYYYYYYYYYILNGFLIVVIREKIWKFYDPESGFSNRTQPFICRHLSGREQAYFLLCLQINKIILDQLVCLSELKSKPAIIFRFF